MTIGLLGCLSAACGTHVLDLPAKAKVIAILGIGVSALLAVSYLLLVWADKGPGGD
jgi:hypothetical protein